MPEKEVEKRSLTIPMFSYLVFTENDLKLSPLEWMGDILRYDYFDFTNCHKEGIIQDKLDKHYKEIKAKGFEYKDFITNRYFFKQFVVRDRTHNTNDAMLYIKYTLDDWKNDNKKERVDSRVLQVDRYSCDINKNGELNYRSFNHSMSFKIKVAHKDTIIDMLTTGKNNRELNINANLYMLPIYILDMASNTYKRISDFGTFRTNFDLMVAAIFIIDTLIDFRALNLYMIDTLESESKVNFIEKDGSHIQKEFIERVKEIPTKDRKVTIDTGQGSKLVINLTENNIFSHDNTVTRSLSEYKYQVSGHYQRYWVGSRKRGNRKRIWRWKESYYKNPDKKFKVIKEIKIKEVGD